MSVFLRALQLILSSLLLAACGGGGGSDDFAFGGGGGATRENSCAELALRDSRLASMSDAGIGLTSQLGLAAGRYALPGTAAPTQLVINFHGNHNDSCAWRNHLREIAARGAIAIAMDYTGQRREGDIDNYGWFMRAGAADSIAAVRHFMTRYPSVTQVFAMGISMGANASGVAIASPDAVRGDGTPLFDYWVAVEGVHNLTEEYFIARAVAPVNGGGAVAQAEIEEENGGSFEQAPDKYAEITNVFRVPDMGYLKGVALVHGIDDGLVPTTQSREMLLALNAAGVPSHLYTVGATGTGETGTTASSIIAAPIFDAIGQDYESPLAGHGWEGSDTHLVINTGFEQLFALMEGATVTPGETPVPGI